MALSTLLMRDRRVSPARNRVTPTLMLMENVLVDVVNTYSSIVLNIEWQNARASSSAIPGRYRRN